MSAVIGITGLQVGQWVVFFHDKKEISGKLQGPFKVIIRNDPPEEYKVDPLGWTTF